jgi:uncharacterized membrane protein YgcG
MSEQKKTRADVIAEIQKTNALLERLVALMERGQFQAAARSTRTTVSGGSTGGSTGGSGGASQGGSGGGGAAV